MATPNVTEAMDDAARVSVEDGLDTVSVTTVLAWLRLLNASENNHDPRLSLREEQRLIEYRRRQPDFSVAAASWPRHAAKYWHVLEDDIMALFTPSADRFNFAQWALEYVRYQCPEAHYVALSTAPGARTSLVDDLCEGRVSPLHMAAILGIPQLVERLVARPADGADSGKQQPGIFGVPIYCALVGPTVIATGMRPADWSDVFQHLVNQDRAATIQRILDASPSCHFSYMIETPADTHNPTDDLGYPLDRATLAGLAFYAALSSRKLAIFDQVMHHGARLDHNLLLLLENARDVLPPVEEDLLYEAFTMLLDFSLGPFFPRPSACEMRFHQVLDSKMHELFRGTAFPHTVLKHVSDASFASTVTGAIVGGQALAMARLSTDPRFDPDMPIKRSGRDGVIAHLAVSGDHFRIVEILMEAGSDFGLVDGQGRTPLMVVESTRMLDLLVVKHGLTTTDRDIGGRNLWHYFAATNDVGLLEWLCEHDPDKVTNMQMTTHVNWTPLDEAVRAVPTTSTRGHRLRERLTRPRSLLRLLEEMKKCGIRAPPTINVGLAVGWGSVEVVDGLMAVGADFGGTDAEGSTILHHLNSTATAALVSRLFEILGAEAAAAKMGNGKGMSPAETILINTFRSYGREEGKWQMSAHPACNAVLDREAYGELLRAEVVGYKNARGQGTWERVSGVVTRALCEFKAMAVPLRLQLLRTVATALRMLVKAGAMRQYEKDKGRTALETLRMQREGWTWWEVKDNPCLELVLRRSDRALLRAFYRTDDAYVLLGEAWSTGTYALIGLLAQTGMPLHAGHGVLDDGVSFIDMILTDGSAEVLSRLGQMLQDEQARRAFVSRKHEIYGALVVGETPLRRQKLVLLLDKGLDGNPPLPPGRDRTWLTTAIDGGDAELAMMMLAHGADPTAGRGGYNAVMAAAGTADLTLMASIIAVVEDRHPGYVWEGAWCDEEDGRTWNALQMAAGRGLDRMLLLLLQTPLRGCVNGGSLGNRATPAHLAAAGGWVECLGVLVERGAGMEVLDGEGRTVLDVAVEGGRGEVVEFLQKL